MPTNSRFPRPTPSKCRDCGGIRLEGLGDGGNWDGFVGGGRIYNARCLECGTVWSLYTGGSSDVESAAEFRWGKEGSATDPPRLPAWAEANPLSYMTVGQELLGTVVNVAQFGLFIELHQRIDGLLLFDRTPNPEIARRLRVGDKLEVLVRAIDIDRMKVELELQEDPTHYEGF